MNCKIFVVFFTVVVVFLIFFQTKQTKLLLEFIQKRILEISSVVTKYVFHNSDSINSDSFRGREAQLSKMLKTYPKYGFIFGIGDISGTGGKYSLENIYMATFSNYGFFGLALYVGFLIFVFLTITQIRRNMCRKSCAQLKIFKKFLQQIVLGR